MNSMRSLEALLYREHESRITSLRGKDLPKVERLEASRPSLETRMASWMEVRQQIVDIARANPSLSAGDIARRVDCSRTTVCTTLRAAGLPTRPQGFKGKMP